MMQVDLEKCTGCGACLEACTNHAITLLAGKAAIDPEACMQCGDCAQVCPVGAILEAQPLAPVRIAVPAAITPAAKPAIRPFEPPAVTPVYTPQTDRQLGWVRPILSLVGTEIVPRLVDALLAGLDRRLAASSNAQTSLVPRIIHPANGRRRQMRRRRRGRYDWSSSFTRFERR